MPRHRAHIPLDVRINNRLVGQLIKDRGGATSFRYAQDWLDWEHGFAVSLSLPLREPAYSGASVTAVFENLLPDNPGVRKRVAERTGAEGADYYSLLERIGRDCVGAMQFLPEGTIVDARSEIEGDAIDDDAIEARLANLAGTPLGGDRDQDFRISVAGAQNVGLRRPELLDLDVHAEFRGDRNHVGDRLAAGRGPDQTAGPLS